MFAFSENLSFWNIAPRFFAISTLSLSVACNSPQDCDPLEDEDTIMLLLEAIRPNLEELRSTSLEQALTDSYTVFSECSKSFAIEIESYSFDQPIEVPLRYIVSKDFTSVSRTALKSQG